MRPEAKVQREIMEFMRLMNFSVWDTSQGYRKDPGGTRMTAGIPDLIFAGHDRTLFVEVKTDKGKLTMWQKLFRTTWTDNGGICLLWRSDRDAFDWLVAEGIIEETAVGALPTPQEDE